MPPRRPDYGDDFDEPKSRFGLWIGIGTLLTILAGAGGGWFYVKNVAPLVPTLQPEPVIKDTGSKTQTPTEPGRAPGSDKTPGPIGTKTDGPVPIAPPQTPETPQAIIASISDAARFIREFDGGPCFFMWPTDLGNRVAKVEGYGPDVGAFTRFIAEFEAAAGYEPVVKARTVSPAQCNVIDALRRISLTRGNGINPGLSLQHRQTLAEGEEFTGEVKAPPNLKLELLVVDDAGKVRRITSALGSDGRFAFPVKASGSAVTGEAPHLLIVLASPEALQPVANLGADSSVDAATVFPRLAQQSEAGGRITLTVGYFKLAAH